MAKKLKFIKALGPAHWASYLINNDASIFDYLGDDGTEQTRADAFAERFGFPVDCQPYGFTKFHDVPDYPPCDVAEFTFQILACQPSNERTTSP